MNSGLVELQVVTTSLVGLLGLVALFQERRSVAVLFSLPLLLFPLPYYLIHPDYRFRILLDPLLTILGAYAICRLYAHLKSRGSRTGLVR